MTLSPFMPITDALLTEVRQTMFALFSANSLDRRNERGPR